MRIRYRWLLAAFAGAALAVPCAGPVQAQAGGAQPPATPPSPGSPSATQQGTFNAPPPMRPGEPVSVLVFPFGFDEPAAAPAAEPPAEGAPAAQPKLSQAQQDLVTYITAAVKAGFLSTPAYSVVSYTYGPDYQPTSSLVRRARDGDVLRAEHVADLVNRASGAVDTDKAKTIAYRLGLQTFLTGTIDVKTDAKTNTVEVTVQSQLVDSTTGQTLRSAAVSGAAAGAEGVPLIAIQERAALDAAQKSLPALGIELVIPQPPAPASTKSRSRSRTAPRAAPKSERRSSADDGAERSARDEQRRARQEAEAAEASRREQARAAEKVRREEERAAEKARKDADKKSRAARSADARAKAPREENPETPRTAAVEDSQPATPAPAAVQPATAAPPGSVKGTANEAGMPVPYGWAMSEKRSLTPRNRSSLRVPPWLGVAGFLAGISFLL